MNTMDDVTKRITNELDDAFEELEHLEIGGEEYNRKLKVITDLTDRLNNLYKTEVELDIKKRSMENTTFAENQRTAELIRDNMSKSRSNIIFGIGNWIITGALTIAVLVFEKNDAVTSLMGKKIIGDIPNLLKKKN